MRPRTIIASVLLLLSLTVRPAQAGSEIAFGITSQTAFSLAHYVATEKKYYEAENLKVDTFVAGAAVQVLQQLAAGSLNMAQAATDQSLRAILRGAPDPDRRRRRLQRAVPCRCSQKRSRAGAISRARPSASAA